MRGLVEPSVAGGFLSEGKPVEALGFFQRAGLHQLHTLHAAVGFVPGVLVEISEDLPRLLDALRIPDRYHCPGIVGADAERHGVTLHDGRAARALGPFGDSHHRGAPRTLLEHVPAELMKYTCATENLQDFNLTGFEVYTMSNLAALTHSGKRLHEFETILDFGCSAGRLLQFIPNAVHSKVHGTDVNKSLIDFVNQTFPGVTTCVNDFDPSLI